MLYSNSLVGREDSSDGDALDVWVVRLDCDGRNEDEGFS